MGEVDSNLSNGKNTKPKTSSALRWILGGMTFALIFFVLCFAAWAILRMFSVPKVSVKFSVLSDDAFVDTQHVAHSTHESALTSFRQTGEIKNGSMSGYTYFKFSDEQKSAIERFAERFAGQTSSALCINVNRASDINTNAQTNANAVVLGFLYENDFEKSGSLKNTLDERALVSADLSYTGDCVLSFAFDSTNLPSGFFVYAENFIMLENVSVQKAVVGWHAPHSTHSTHSSNLPADRSVSKNFYGFFSDGGSAAQSYDVNFSGASNSWNEEDSVVTIYFTEAEKLPYNSDMKTVGVFVGAENFRVLRAAGTNEVRFPRAVLSSNISRVAIFGGQQFVNGITVSYDERSEFAPCIVDASLIPSLQRKNWRWRDYEIFAWDRFPHVLIFDFADYAVQDNFLKRLAFYVEKAGFRGRLLTDKELDGKHAYNAHDYSAESLASFFEKARREKFQLNESEYLLRDILLANKIIMQGSEGVFSKGEGAIISIAQESPDYLRERLLAHEAWHGIYFVDEGFRAETRRVFDMTDSRSLEFMIGYFTTTPGLNYDVNDTNLLANEFMSYLLQQPQYNTAAYFVSLANRATVQKRIPYESAYVRETDGMGFARAATEFDKYVFERWGLSGGRVGLVSKM